MAPSAVRKVELGSTTPYIEPVDDEEGTSSEALQDSAPPTLTEAPAVRPSTRRRGLGAITGRLTASTVSVALVGIVTGPLMARALGPAGRGEYAAILVPFGFLPTIASAGLGSYATRAVARGQDPGEQLGSLLPVAMLIAFVIAAASPVIAGLFAGGRAVVYTMLMVGFVTFPVGMFTNMLVEVAIGLEQWGPVLMCRFIPPMLQLIGIPLLFFTGNLTVTTAAVMSFVGGLLTLLPVLGVWRFARPLKFNAAELRAGVAFGAKCWFGGLSSLANARLDQLLMTRLVSSAVLGVYAVAVNLATFVISPVVSAVTTAAAPRMARGAEDLTTGLCRLAIIGATAVCLCMGVLSPFVLHYVFGPSFEAALPMTLILLAGTIPNSVGGILNTSVSAHGQPGYAARGETLALVVTVGGLLVALPTLGGVGAAIVSVIAYTTQSGYMVRVAKRVHGGRYRDYLVPTRAEFAMLGSELARRWARGRRVLLRQV
jgi:O-antigen/teichoic acid export membrane protein